MVDNGGGRPAHKSMGCDGPGMSAFLLGLFTGTFSTITIKVAYQMTSVGEDGVRKAFEKPLTTTCFMFMAMAMGEFLLVCVCPNVNVPLNQVSVSRSMCLLLFAFYVCVCVCVCGRKRATK